MVTLRLADCGLEWPAWSAATTSFGQGTAQGSGEVGSMLGGFVRPSDCYPLVSTASMTTGEPSASQTCSSTCHIHSLRGVCLLTT
jgi:hypothetical protein